MPIEWKPYLATHVDEVDEQHKELFSKVNDLFEAAKKHKAIDEFPKTMAFLEAYASFHFSTEERCFEEHGYPLTKEHAARHAEFIANITTIKAEVTRNGVTATTIIAMNKMIVDWLINHVGGSDRAFGEFLRDQTRP